MHTLSSLLLCSFLTPSLADHALSQPSPFASTQQASELGNGTGDSRDSTELLARQAMAAGQRAADQRQSMFATPKPEQLWPLLRASVAEVEGGRERSLSPGWSAVEGVSLGQWLEQKGSQGLLKPLRSPPQDGKVGNQSSRISRQKSSRQLRSNPGATGSQPNALAAGTKPQRQIEELNGRFSQRIAVGPATTLQVRGERILPFETDLKLEDEYKTRYSLSFRRSLAKSPQQEFSLSFGFAYRDQVKAAPPPSGARPSSAGFSASDAQPQLLAMPSLPTGGTARSPRPSRPSGLLPSAALPGPPTIGGEERTTVLEFGQDYKRRDRAGSWTLASRLNFGTGLLDATATTDDSADGQFFSWKGEVQRSQRFSRNHQLTLKLSTQLASDSLMGSEQFKIGNGPKIEGLQIRDDRGDNGLRLALEDRWTLARAQDGSSRLELIPLLDAGYVWNRSSGSNSSPAAPARATRAFSLHGGLGLSWSPYRDNNLSLSVRVPLLYANDIEQTASDKDSRLNFSYRMRW